MPFVNCWGAQVSELAAPQLRVAGFDGDWEELTLGDVSLRINTKNADRVTEETFTNSAQYGIISQLEYFDNSVSNPENIGGYYIVEPNDFVYNPRISMLAPYGPVNRNKLGRRGATSPLYSVFRPSGIDHSFLEYFFKSDLWHDFMRMNGDTGARHDRFAIGVDDFYRLGLSRPSTEEQQAIGSIFTQFDRLIGHHRSKHERLQQTKISLMQRMFPEGNAEQPRLRFQSFAGPWKTAPLLDAIRSIIDFRGRTPKKLGMDWSETGHLALSANNVKHGYVDFARDPHYGDDALYARWMAGRELHKGQVVFTTEAPMGNVAQVPDTRKYILSQRVIAFEVIPNRITEGFLKVVLGSPLVFAQLTSLSSGGTAQGVSRRSLSQVQVCLPVDLEEQRRIAAIFSRLDDLIFREQLHINKLLQVKSGLLQKMFI